MCTAPIATKRERQSRQEEVLTQRKGTWIAVKPTELDLDTDQNESRQRSSSIGCSRAAQPAGSLSLLGCVLGGDGGKDAEQTVAPAENQVRPVRSRSRSGSEERAQRAGCGLYARCERSALRRGGHGQPAWMCSSERFQDPNVKFKRGFIAVEPAVCDVKEARTRSTSDDVPVC
ncbi:hypothetical protein INR49_002907 [Caranx melampygus]|nr:hypothetical protein INR49_002907 [Caranx melampygus]